MVFQDFVQLRPLFQDLLDFRLEDQSLKTLQEVEPVSYRPRCRNDSSQRCSLKQLGELVLFFRREIEDIQQNTLK